MAVAAQLHGSAAAAAGAAYRRLPLYRVPSSCRWPRSPLAALPELSISTGGVGMSPFGVGAKVSTKCANGTTQVDELNLRSNQTEELVEADEDTVTQNRSAKIHDFCLGIPFAEGVYWRVGADIHKVIHMLEKRIGVIQSETKAILPGPKRNIGGLLFCMGLLGYIFSRSTISLVLGVAPGLATLFLGTLSLNFWRSGKSSFMFILGQAAISAVLAWKYSHAYILTNRILPWAFYASLSTAMACFYAYVLLSGGNPPPKKKMASTPSS